MAFMEGILKKRFLKNGKNFFDFLHIIFDHIPKVTISIFNNQIVLKF